MSGHHPAVPDADASRASLVVAGKAAILHRITPNHRAAVCPGVDNPADLWLMPGGMRYAILTGEYGYALLLAYVDEGIRSAAIQAGLPERLALDVWHFQPLDVADDHMAQEVCRCLARAVADGTLPYEPIRAEDRRVWQAAADSVARVLTATREADR